MNKLAGISCICGLALGVLGSAAADTDFYDYAPVLDAVPIVEEIEVPVQREHCRRVHAPARHGRYSYTPTIVGGIIGGAIAARSAVVTGAASPRLLVRCWAPRSATTSQHHHRRVSRRPVQRCSVIEEYDVQEQVVGSG